MMDVTLQEFLGAFASLMGIVGTVIYVRSILKGRTKPHLYSWLVFAILTGIAFTAQISDNAGPGAWVMGFTAASCALIALLSLKYGEQNITISDKIALAVSLSAIIPWLLLDDPLLSVIIISVIDVFAMYPTVRKTWHKPFEENLTPFNIATIKSIISMFALTNITVVTTLYPFMIVAVNTLFVLLCLYRRQVLKKPATI